MGYFPGDPEERTLENGTDYCALARAGRRRKPPVETLKEFRAFESFYFLKLNRGAKIHRRNRSNDGERTRKIETA